jgi:8-oxo-dGTP diphosphatase
VRKVIDRRASNLYIFSFRSFSGERRSTMADNPILAAGGIVVRGNTRPTVAVVQLRKDGNWVLPKGKLNRGEDALTAAQREVHEETGHSVTVKEFVGTLCYEVNGRSKIVQFWRMHPNGGPARELMDDIKQVAWLPLEKAIRKLARPHEKAFLASAGPAAIKSHRETTAIRVLSRTRVEPTVTPVEPLVVNELLVVNEPSVFNELLVVNEPTPIAMGSVDGAASRPRNVVARALGWLRRRRA